MAISNKETLGLKNDATITMRMLKIIVIIQNDHL